MSTALKSRAEQLADKSRELPNFKSLSLPGIREAVAAILNLIGRNDVFATYTLHDISHIDAMLQMLDWLVPESTQRAMTPVDWLLLVLSIYFHDLGLVTTAHEFDGRVNNLEFTTWRASLDQTTDGREYIARTNRMSPSEQDHFFFQEFIRKGHALRIKEWVTGRNPTRWGPDVAPIASEIANLLAPAPARFREYLGVVCESHHSADLDKLDRYPLAMRFGNDPLEIANVQYAGILLRTADLLHITRDRTPSVMYKAIRFSDPKSVAEWDKQQGTFAVGPKGRRLVEGDPESAVVVVNADFTEERPLFSLQEYIAYADAEIKQSVRWAAKSQETPDAKLYSFPWRSVTGDVRLEGIPPQPMRFELDRGQLLDLLVGHTIYNEPTVAVRELLQNGIDAVRYQHYLDERQLKREGTDRHAPWGSVTVRWKPSEKTLVIQDDGIGMDRDVIRDHLMSVGSSFYNTPQFEQENQDFVPISRFGIGILTCFMISDDVEIVTFNGSRGHRVRMTSVKSTYLLRELEPGDQLLDGVEPHGTRVTLRIRDTVNVSKPNMLEIVAHWVILPECKVVYEEPSQKPIQIGFDSVNEALLGFLKAEEYPPRPGQEVVLKHREGGPGGKPSTARYELAFPVVSGFFPERSFLVQRNQAVPRVCIEGIRVAEQLPGFRSGEDAIGALLSVRGSRKFRTTVSRAGLEADDEYERASALCADMFFEHVRDEARRISAKPGKPISQAARGCQYLIQQIERSSYGVGASVVIERLADEQPTMVLETVRANGEQSVTSRELISRNQLLQVPEFWTIESRSVDALGTISLDLGRELSLNDFLISLAPDATQLRYSPIVPDAHNSRTAISSSHQPERAEFSKKHQQTAIKWTRKPGQHDITIDLPSIVQREFLDEIMDESRGTRARLRGNYRFYVGSSRSIWGLTLFTSLSFGQITGDDSMVRAVTTRMGTVIEPSCSIAASLIAIRSVVIAVLTQVRKVDDALTALNIAGAFETALSLSGGRPSGEARSVWREHIANFKGIAAQLGIRTDLSSDIDDQIEGKDLFDATSYWRDWDRNPLE